MSSVVLSGDTSGTVTLTVPAVAGTNTVTIAAQTGTLNAAGPAFSAYLPTANQSISPSTWTKVSLSAEEFDTNNNFDSTTNYRFTPAVAGYYQINGAVQMDASTYGTDQRAAIYKNGSIYKSAGAQLNTGQLGGSGVTVSAIVYLNGSTDYVELWGYADNSTNVRFTFGSTRTYFTGCLLRGA